MATSSQGPRERGQGPTTRARSPDRTVKPHERAATEKLKEAEYQKRYLAAHRDELLAYKKAYYAKNRERLLAIQAKQYDPAESAEYSRRYRADNHERLKEQKRKYYLENRESILAKKRIYTRKVSKDVIAKRRAKRAASLAEMAKHNHNGSLRRATETQAIPKWADIRAVRSFYTAAQYLTTETGIKHSVDHFYPLRGELVCGLHVPENLRVIPLFDNCSKQNSFKVDDIV